MYLDHNATSPPTPAVIARVTELMSTAWGNPSAIHREGVRARQVLEDARPQVARLGGARPSQLVFTSGATEANVTALSHLARDARRLVTVATEHPSVLKPLEAMAADGEIALTIIGVDHDGRCDLEALERALMDADGLALMAANNETGVVADLEAVARLVEMTGVSWHCDAVQAVGRFPVDMNRGPWRAVTTLTFSGHKIGGPMGVGALLTSGDTTVTPLLRGGGQQGRRRAGTPAVAAIGGFAVAAQTALASDWSSVARRRDRLESSLLDTFPGSIVHGAGAPRLPNTSSIAIRADSGWADGEDLVLALAETGVAVSTGAACASGEARPSHVLLAMGADAVQAQATLRFSLGTETGDDDIDQVLGALDTVVRGPQSQPL